MDPLIHHLSSLQGRSNFVASERQDQKSPILSPNSGKLLPLSANPSQSSNSNKEARKLIGQLQQVMLGQHSLSFSIDQKSGDIFIIVRDAETGHVLKEIPSRDLRELAQSLLHLQEEIRQDVGLLLDVNV
tara:strand:+ start:153 stop:542 length:390 start_codon:yes stop_codon:yes gene_type:complete